MEQTIEKILKIQNKQKSLKWGHHVINPDEVMFVVGHQEYPKSIQYFVLKNNAISLIDDNHKKCMKKECENEKEVLSTVIGMLKVWFPAKNV